MSVTPPTAPSGLILTVLSKTQIKLDWTDNSSNEDGFKIQRCSGEGCTPISLTQVGANITTYTSTPLTSGLLYSFRVAATNAGGDSAYTPIESIRTLIDPVPLPSPIVNYEATEYPTDQGFQPINPVYEVTNYTRLVEQLGRSASDNMGNSSTVNTSLAQGFQLTAAETVAHFAFFVTKVGTPTDNLVGELRTDDGTGKPSSTLLASFSVAASSLEAGINLVVFDIAGQALNASTTYHICITRSGAIHASNYYQVHRTTTNAYTSGAVSRKGSTTWTADATVDYAFQVMSATARQELVKFLLRSISQGKVFCYTSLNKGASWERRDYGNDPNVAVSSIARDRSRLSSHLAGNEITLGLDNGGLAFSRFDTRGMVWHKPQVVNASAVYYYEEGTFEANRTALWNVTRSDGVKIFVLTYNETVSSVVYTRYKLVYYTTTWSSILDIATGTTSELGAAYHIRVRAMILLGDNLLIAWSRSDTDALQIRLFKSDNTFTTIINPQSVTVEDDQDCSIGVPCTYTEGGVSKVALPVHASDDALKMLRAPAATADVSGDWTIETVDAQTGKFAATSRYQKMIAESDGGERLFLVRRDSADQVELFSDRGRADWMSYGLWRAGAGGQAPGHPDDAPPAAPPMLAQYMTLKRGTDRLHFTVLNTGETPDENTYDSLYVPFVKESRAIGEYSVEVAMNERRGSIEVTVEADGAVDSIAYADIHHRQDETSEWVPLGSVQGSAVFGPVWKNLYFVLRVEGASDSVGVHFI